MALFEKLLHLKTILPALTVSDVLTPEDAELLLPILMNCGELDETLLLSNCADDGDLDALDMLECPAAKRRRKRTYELRKDEIDALEKSAALLSAKLDFLKHRAGVQDEQSLAQQELNNSVLREALRNQQFLVAGFRSMMATDKTEHVLSPVSTRIHLESDLAERRQLLKSLKFQKLHDARRFLEKRAQFSPKTTRFSETTRRRAVEGDTIAIRFDVVPLTNATGVKQVYDALLFYFANLEICMTETLGDVTVREESAESAEKDKDSSITQHRFLYTSRLGLKVETNSVIFAEYKPNQRCPQTGELREEAIFVSDFVDQDDLFPYSPHERLRKDITSILQIQSYERRPKSSAECAGLDSFDELSSTVDDQQESEPVVVMTTWFQTSVHRCKFEVPEDRLQELIEDTDRVHEAILKSVRASIRCVAS